MADYDWFEDRDRERARKEAARVQELREQGLFERKFHTSIDRELRILGCLKCGVAVLDVELHRKNCPASAETPIG